MKYLKLFLAVFLPLLLAGCWGYGVDDDDPSLAPQNYKAVTMTRQALEASVVLAQPQPMVKSGKIYVKDNLMFVSDVNKGFHIYAYNNAGQPDEVAFLKAPGATDLAVRGTTLYINQATDLVTLVYANNAITVVKRNPNVFPQKVAPDNSWASVTEDEIIIDWIPR